VRILFLSHYFPPEVNAPANRTHEHCREWAAAGHEVHVITCVPSHPVGKPFPGYRTGWYSHECIDGIHVHRVWTYLAANRGIARRTLNFLSFVPSAIFRALRLGRFDVVIGTSPQFFCAAATWLFATMRGVPWVFELRDLWPESIPAVGAMGKSWMLTALEKLELRMYRDAAAVVCVTRSFIRNLSERGIEPSKLSFIPNGIMPSFWNAAERTRARARAGVADHEVVASYVGTIGMAHGLGTVLDAAAMLRDAAPAVKFWIVGDGAELERLKADAAKRALTNVHFTGLVAREDIPSILAGSDISLVTLRPSDVFKTVLPSKMFESMAARRAIVLAVDGEARETLQRAEAGVAVPPGDATALAGAIARLAANPDERQRMGEAGCRFVEREFSRRAFAEQYIQLLESLASATVSELPAPETTLN
jgi:glycosyltransferase involved in cell wall biosynthesis